MTPDDPAQDPDKLMTYPEVAARLHLGVPTLRRLVHKLRIPYVRMSSQLVRFHYPTVLKYLQDREPSP
jgi:excisionase family DNA binding protein